jgi:hypothetical protein
MIRDKDGHIASPLIMYTCTVFRHVLRVWPMNKSDHSKPSYSNLISKKHFRLARLAGTEWTHSVRAVRDTPGLHYSATGVKTTRGVAYRPPIAVPPFLLALLLSYFKQTLWRGGKL